MKGFLVAAAFLTRIPIPVSVETDADLGKSVPWFPIVGGLIGTVVGSVLYLLSGSLNGVMAAALAVALSLGLTGAFHEDGLADTFDGLGSGRRGHEAIAIMRDSRLGTYGSAALVLSLLIHVLALAGMSRADVIVVVLAAHASSRAFAVVAMLVAPVASDSGLGAGYGAAINRPAAVLGAGVGIGGGAILLGPQAWGLAVGAAGAFLVVAWAMRKINGITGDVLGAVQQVAMLGVLVVATI